MTNQKKSDSYGATPRLLALLVTGLLAFGLMPLAAADVSVIRDLPDAPVYPGTVITVTLNQTGFFLTGVVYETLPDGFIYQGLAPESGGEYMGYDRTANNLTLGFGLNEATLQYLVETGTAEQLEAAVFAGTWRTMTLGGDKISGEVEGDTILTLATGPTPTPTPSNGGGGGGGGGTTPTPTTSPTPTASISPSPSASPGMSPTPTGSPSTSPSTTPTSPTPTAGPTTSPAASPTAKPGIPGFELIFALAGLLTVAQWLWRRRSE